MELKKDYFDWIEDYLANRLDSNQKQEFENELTHNDTLRMAVDHFPLAQKIAASLIEDEVHQKLIDLKKKSNSRLFSSPWFRIAASILVVVGLFLTWKITLKDTFSDRKELMANLYIRPAQTGIRGEISDFTLLDTAILLFEQNKYQASFNILNRISNSDSLIVLRYKAHNSLQLGKLDEAAGYFEQLLRIDKLKYYNESRYHLMLIYLLQGKMTEAKVIYQEMKDSTWISQEKSDYLKKVFD